MRELTFKSVNFVVGACSSSQRVFSVARPNSIWKGLLQVRRVLVASSLIPFIMIT